MLIMLFSSITYCFFTKVAFKSFGSVYYSDDRYLTTTAKYGFFCAAFSRFGWAGVGQLIGFKRVYAIILSIQVVICFTIYFAAQNPTLYTIWICLSWSCEGGHFSIFPPLSGKLYGPV